MRYLALLLFFYGCTYVQAAPTSMYRCEVQGVTTYSDRPCGADATVHEPSESLNTFAAPQVVPSPQPKQQRSARAARKGALNDDLNGAKRAELCAKLQRSEKEVRSKMRSGYKAKEGERLRERLAKLRSQSDTAKCK